jgi:hypothetical protein
VATPGAASETKNAGSDAGIFYVWGSVIPGREANPE